VLSRLPRNAPVWLDRLSAWLEPFEGCFTHVAQRGAFRRYLLGLLSDSRRKSMSAMLERVHDRGTYQAFLIASVWLFLAVTVAPTLSPVGLPANLACVAVFGLGVATAWRRLPHYEGRNARLLLLRSFTLGERSNRLFQDLESLWRSIGSIQLVGAVDLALTTLEPHELLDFLRGQSGREFVHYPPDVDARLESFDQTRDPDGRFCVNVIFCRGDAIWKYAVDRMLVDSDCVLMDLRGFSRHRAGCVFEIRCLAESDLPFRTVFLVDESTDRGFVSETWAAASNGASGRPHGDAFQFVTEQPSTTTLSQRIIAAFSSPEAHHAAQSAQGIVT
jgi:hypothetical protein